MKPLKSVSLLALISFSSATFSLGDTKECRALMCLSVTEDVPAVCLPIRKVFFDLPATKYPQNPVTDRYRFLSSCAFEGNKTVVEGIMQNYGRYASDPAGLTVN